MDYLDVLTGGTSSVDEAHGRVYGWIPGIVTDIDTKLMRVKARIGKQGDNDSTDWLVPIGVGSVESLPEVNDPVGVMFADGDVHRGAYFYFPQSTTKNRPTQHAMLGDVFVGMFNYLVTQFNQLRSDFNNHTHSVPYSWTGVAGSSTATAAKPTASTSNDGNKGKASDGSTVADKSTSEVVLSKRTVVR